MPRGEIVEFRNRKCFQNTEISTNQPASNTTSHTPEAPSNSPNTNYEPPSYVLPYMEMFLTWKCFLYGNIDNTDKSRSQSRIRKMEKMKK